MCQTSFGVTDDERDDPQLITSFIAKANLGNTDPKGSLSQQQGNDEGTINYSFYHFNTGTNSDDDDEEEIKQADLTELVKETDEVQNETDDTSVPQPFPSPKSIKIQDGTLGDLKKYVEQLEIEVLGELKDLPNKLQDFQASISVLTTKVASLEGLKLYIPARLLSLPSQVSSISSQLTKLRVLDAILSMLGKVVAAMDRFAKAIDPASQKAGDQSVP
ncbi:hypothetical protein Tco_1302735 [Tanacetum coccineum]